VNKPGFSLIEVLVAMVIVSLITTTGMFAFKLAINQIDRQSSLTFDEPMRFTQIKNLFNATYFYVEEKNDKFRIDEFEYIYKFNKNEREITFVSNAPIYTKQISLINLKIQDRKLMYKEEPIYTERQNYKAPVFFNDTREYEILNEISNASFSYEDAIDLPKEISLNIPKIIKLNFLKNNIQYTYIFDTKYNFYNLKEYLKSKRVVR